MNYKTHNEGILSEGGSLQGSIEVTYKELKNAFGKPSLIFDDYKSDAEWQIKFEDGTYVAIYNYKNGQNYNGSQGIPKTKITDWHIGGKSKYGVDLVKDILDIK